MMRSSTLYFRFLLLATGVILVATAPAQAAEETIKPGDKVKVVNGPAPVKDRAKTLTTIETGTEVTALAVRGPWVKVTVERDRKGIAGWIYGKKYLKRVPGVGASKPGKGQPGNEPAARAPAKEDEGPRAEEAPKGRVRAKRLPDERIKKMLQRGGKTWRSVNAAGRPAGDLLWIWPAQDHVLTPAKGERWISFRVHWRLRPGKRLPPGDDVWQCAEMRGTGVENFTSMTLEKGASEGTLDCSFDGSEFSGEGVIPFYLTLGIGKGAKAVSNILLLPVRFGP